MRGTALAFSILVLIPTAMVAPAAAGSADKDPLAWVPPTHIQMLPMMLPVGNRTAPMTLFLEATQRERVTKICEHMPRVRDALLRTLSRSPIPVRNQRIVVRGIDKKLLKPLNKAVGRKYIKKIHITPGAVKMGGGKIKSNRQAVIDGCENILRSELERAQAARAAQ